MAEKVTGKKWNDIIRTELIQPLGLDKEVAYFSNPVDREGEINPSAFDGLVISMKDYVRVLKSMMMKNENYLSNTLLDKMVADQFSKKTAVEFSPMKMFLQKNYHFGLGNWIECEPGGKLGCGELNVRSCPGAFGWYPFIDLGKGYYGLLASLEGHDRQEKSAEPTLRSWRILQEVRKVIDKWKL